MSQVSEQCYDLRNCHEQALAVIEKLETALFKIACGQVGELILSRAGMIDIAEDALPKNLQELCLQYGKRRTRKKRRADYDWMDKLEEAA